MGLGSIDMSEPRLSIKGVLEGGTYALFINEHEYDSGYVVEIFYDYGKSAYLGVYEKLEDAEYEAVEIAKKYIEAVPDMECLYYECG